VHRVASEADDVDAVVVQHVPVEAIVVPDLERRLTLKPGLEGLEHARLGRVDEEGLPGPRADVQVGPRVDGDAEHPPLPERRAAEVEVRHLGVAGVDQLVASTQEGGDAARLGGVAHLVHADLLLVVEPRREVAHRTSTSRLGRRRGGGGGSLACGCGEASTIAVSHAGGVTGGACLAR